MKILAIDIGTGTQDMMLHDSNKNMENAIKMVIPSPTHIMANKVQKTDQNIYFGGDIMGGGPINRAIKHHLEKGHKVVMEENAAKTIRDNLKRVKSLGITVLHDEKYVSEKYPDFKKIELKDVDLDRFQESLASFGCDLEFDYLGIAVQDHGYNEKMGDRNFRFMKIKEKLDEPLAPEEFAYWGDIPEYFTRMKAVERTLSGFKPLLMDSKFAAMCGATCDPKVNKLDSYVVMDVGNGHTTAASISNGKIMGVFEHHTGSLNSEKIERFLNKLVDATLSHEEVHRDHGHGAWVLNSIDELDKVVVTGPRRELVDKTNLPVYHAAPAGDVMMTGPVGLIKSINYKIENNIEFIN
ncbi:DUF1786 domain-containing protein [Methanobacterium alcaliphilum]|uniref:DUF1786 domain-containing protein n=1 Tax=Methanobacterium alcaliphilum TaxID=392018 RepID=UPI00200AECEC|nr:DUF1786 domain-containing protein [Methanobacterium alcaliphilum]MCK9152371.1 DUF1786 domain-containing protein [Methanobacterium alcaliphilum]